MGRNGGALNRAGAPVIHMVRRQLPDGDRFVGGNRWYQTGRLHAVFLVGYHFPGLDFDMTDSLKQIET